MPDFTPEDRSTLRNWVINFHNEWVSGKVVRPLEAHLRVVPASVRSIIDDLVTLEQNLTRTENIESRFLPLLKRAVIWPTSESGANYETSRFQSPMSTSTDSRALTTTIPMRPWTGISCLGS